MEQRIRTEADAVMPNRLPEQTVQLPHLAQGRLGPTILGDHRLYLLSKCRDALRHRSEIIQCVRNGLACQ